MMSDHDDPLGVLANMSVRPSRWQLFLLGVTLGLPLGVAGLAGFALAAVSLAMQMRHDRRRHDLGRESVEPLFPSPG